MRIPTTSSSAIRGVIAMRENIADMANSFSRPGDVILSGEAGRHSGGSPVWLSDV